MNKETKKKFPPCKKVLGYVLKITYICRVIETERKQQKQNCFHQVKKNKKVLGNVKRIPYICRVINNNIGECYETNL